MNRRYEKIWEWVHEVGETNSLLIIILYRKRGIILYSKKKIIFVKTDVELDEIGLEKMTNSENKEKNLRMPITNDVEMLRLCSWIY